MRLGAMRVWGPRENCGDSASVLEHLDDWVISREADIIHLNCGLHDMKRVTPAGPCQVPLDQYRENLRAIFSRIRDAASVTLIWATVTPVNEEHHQANKSFTRLARDVDDYNRAALETCRQYELAVNDLEKTAHDGGLDAILSIDGVHFLDEGYRLLGAAVAQAVARRL